MRIYDLANQIPLDGVSYATGDTVDLLNAAVPFLDGYSAILAVDSDGLSDATINVQVSDDATNWTTVKSYTGTTLSLSQITLKRYVRVNVADGGSAAGFGSVFLIGN